MNNFLEAELRVIFARHSFGLIKQREPSFWLVSKHEFNLYEEPTWFIHSEYVNARTPSVHTWEAAAYDLSVWLQYLQGSKIDWRAATEADRDQFAHDFSESVTKDGRGYDDGTINRYLRTVRRFYQFASENGWYFGDIGTSMTIVDVSNVPIDIDALAHTKNSGGRSKLRDPLFRKVGRKDVVRPLQISQLRKLLNYLGPDPIEREGDGRRVRDRLIADLGWQCGLRLSDIVNLTTLKFLSIIVVLGEQAKGFTLIVEKGKGKVTRMVSVPGWLVLSIQEYIGTERAQSERKGGKKTTALFLGHANSKAAGAPLSNSAVQKIFSKACIACGITEQQELIDPDTQKKFIKTVPAHSFHDLRHNCAVLMYHSEKAMGNSEPWKKIQLTLGHKHLQTTINTYLAHVEIFGERQGVADFRKVIGL